MENPTPSHNLDDMELLVLRGMAAREREIERDYLVPFRNDFTTFLRRMEERLGLESGAIGTTHLLDADSGKIVVVPPTPEPPTPETPVATGLTPGDQQTVA